MNILERGEWIHLSRQFGINRKKTEYARYLFLDFDGVVNGIFIDEEETENEKYKYFSPKRVSRISSMCLRHNLSIVFTSSWRYEGIEACHRLLLDAGLSPAVKVSGRTDTRGESTREERIVAFLEKQRDAGAVLILDDIPMRILEPYSVHTDMMHGFDEAAYKKAEKILVDNFHI